MSDTPMKDLERLDDATRSELNNPDLDLVTDYVAGELDPAQVEAVLLRLENDATFREFAAPILVAWGIAPHWQRFPMQRSEIEAGWDEFTRRAGFAHQRRKVRRRRWLLFSILLLAAAIPTLLYSRDLRTAWRDWREFRSVPYDTGWITLRDGHEVRMERGTRLLTSDIHVGGVYRVRLEGSARFRVQHPDTLGAAPGLLPLEVQTRAGTAFIGMGDCSVRTVRDTTYVEALPPSRPRFIGFIPMPSIALVRTLADPNPIQLRGGQRALLVRGRAAMRLPLESAVPPTERIP